MRFLWGSFHIIKSVIQLFYCHFIVVIKEINIIYVNRSYSAERRNEKCILFFSPFVTCIILLYFQGRPDPDLGPVEATVLLQRNTNIVVVAAPPTRPRRINTHLMTTATKTLTSLVNASTDLAAGVTHIPHLQNIGQVTRKGQRTRSVTIKIEIIRRTRRDIIPLTDIPANTGMVTLVLYGVINMINTTSMINTGDDVQQQ